jgi:hypothetical protein
MVEFRNTFSEKLNVMNQGYQQMLANASETARITQEGFETLNCTMQSSLGWGC